MSDQDQIIDAVMARALQVDTIRTHPLVAWVVTRDEGAPSRRVRGGLGLR
jgi:hypothetical protein